MRRALQTDRRTRAPAPRRNRRFLAAYLGLVGALSLALSSAPQADVTIGEEGRQTRTRAKQVQASIDGYPLDLAYRTPIGAVPGADTRPSGRAMRSNGRYLSARPTGPFTVGLMGCPGCLQMLEALGGVWVDARPPRRGNRHR